MRRITISGLVITGLFLSLSASATLFGVLPATPMDTDWLAYYDDQLDITWAADANIDGGGTWDGEMAWVTSLAIGGVGGWRLPSMDVNGDDVTVVCTAVTQAECQDNQYGHMYNYGAGTVLGGGITPPSQGPFSNVESFPYWSSTEWPSDPVNSAMGFHFGTNVAASFGKSTVLVAWAVHDGNIAAVPLPAAVWLFGSALGLLAWMRRKKAS
jgi:hypothetical protein